MNDQVRGLPSGSRMAERRLDNGLRTLAIEVPSARQVRLVCAIGVGYLDEPEELPGLAHLLEHALFLGSPRHPKPGEFATWIGDQGGRYNAHTDEYTTDVHLTLPPEAAQAGLKRLLDIVLHPFLSAPLIAQEIEVIEAEFRARLADPELHRQRAMSRLFKASHPAFRCHHGNRRSLRMNMPALESALHGFHTRHYHANNLSLVMLGPQPLEQQLDLMATAADEISGGADALPTRPWRWAEPARIQWSPPEGQSFADPTLELIWPLPDPLTHPQRQVAERLVHTLGDGELTATLQQHDALCDLESSLAADGGAPFLSLTLSASGYSYRESLIATCQTWVERVATRLTSDDAISPLDSPIHDLDAWPKLLARRLAANAQTLSINPCTQDSSVILDGLAVRTLAPLLTAKCCRILEAVPILEQGDTLAETGTRFCRYPSLSPASVWPPRSPPSISRRAMLSDDNPPSPGLIADSEDFTLWWGGGPPLADAFWCLGWPAPAPQQAARLTRWQQGTLALRQAAQAQGMALELGGDERGDWLMATGDADRLESCLEQALRLWPPQVNETRRASTQGLLAQRLLNRLDTLPTPSQKSGSPPLAWAGGTLSADEIRAGCQRLMTDFRNSLVNSSQTANAHAAESLLVPAPSTVRAHGMGWPTRWLTPQGEDVALMLQIDAPDSSPKSQALFQLLAQCHNAAFEHQLRQHQKLGYVAAVRYREAADGWPRLGYVVQSPHASSEALREAVSAFLKTQGVALARLDTAVFTRRCAALHTKWGAPETPQEALTQSWQALRRQQGVLASSRKKPQIDILTPWKAQQRALRELTPQMLSAQTRALVEGRLSGQWWAHSPLQEGPHGL